MAHPSHRPGNAADFHRLYRESYPRVVRTLVAILRDREAAEDCAQEAFVQAWRAWGRWKPDAPAEAWLHRIAIRVAVSHLRRERLRRLPELLRRIGPQPPGEDPAGNASTRQGLLEALRRLPPAQAAVLVLRHLHGYSNREIAAALGIPETTVGSRLAGAKERLRGELGGATAPGVRPTGESSLAASDALSLTGRRQ